MRRTIAALLACVFCSVATAASSPPVQLLVLGTYHMDNPEQDLVNVQAADVLTPRRQAELAAVAKALAAFRPTIVAVERVTAAPSYVDDRYESFSEADLATSRDERVQVGYRLARTAGLTRVHGIDEQPTAGEPDYFPFDKVQASVQARGQQAALGAVMERAGRMVAQFGERQAQNSIAQLLRQANDPRSLAGASMYYEMLDLDAGEDQPGAELLGYWYMRNAKIFAKLRDVTQPGDRVVVLFGAGHKHWLEQIARNSGGFEVLDATQYLPAD